jgi:hypothetical protein
MISMFKLFLDSAIEIDLELVLRGVKNKMGWTICWKLQ